MVLNATNQPLGTQDPFKIFWAITQAGPLTQDTPVNSNALKPKNIRAASTLITLHLLESEYFYGIPLRL